MMLYILATGTDEGNPKEGEAKEKQNNHTDPCTVPQIMNYPRFRRCIAIGAFVIHGPGA